jgi:hypothetical protein
MVLALAFLTATSSCANLTVKVSKKPRNVSSVNAATEKDSAIKAFENAEDFLKSVDGLKGSAVETIIAELAQSNYRKRFRDGFRYYRKNLIEKASQPITDKNSFYSSSKKCQDSNLSLNIEDADQYLGMIMQVGLLATLSKGSHATMNSTKQKELAAISELILKDLGISAKGESTVSDVDGKKLTEGSFELKLVSDSSDSDEVKAADAVEVLNLDLRRLAGKNNEGTFDATLTLGHFISANYIKTIKLDVQVERNKEDGLWFHQAKAKLGIVDGETLYSHVIRFDEVEDEEYEIKITDTLNAGLSNEETFVTIYDLEAGKQCKSDASDDDSEEPSKPSDGNDDDKDPEEELPPPGDDDDCSVKGKVVSPGEDPCNPGKPTQGPSQGPAQK